MSCTVKFLSDTGGFSQYAKTNYVNHSNQHALVPQPSLSKRLQHSTLSCRASEQQRQGEKGASTSDESRGNDAVQSVVDQLDSNSDGVAISSDVILGACVRTSGLIALAAVGIHFAAPLFAPAKFDGHEALFDTYYNGAIPLYYMN